MIYKIKLIFIIIVVIFVLIATYFIISFMNLGFNELMKKTGVDKLPKFYQNLAKQHCRSRISWGEDNRDCCLESVKQLAVRKDYLYRLPQPNCPTGFQANDPIRWCRGTLELCQMPFITLAKGYFSDYNGEDLKIIRNQEEFETIWKLIIPPFDYHNSDKDYYLNRSVIEETTDGKKIFRNLLSKEEINYYLSLYNVEEKPPPPKLDFQKYVVLAIFSYSEILNPYISINQIIESENGSLEIRVSRYGIPQKAEEIKKDKKFEFNRIAPFHLIVIENVSQINKGIKFVFDP